MPVDGMPEVVVRPAMPEDAEVCGRICFDAFAAINTAHGFPIDFPDSGMTQGLMTVLFGSRGFWCVVAEIGGRVVGSNCLDERSVIRGVGPVSIDPAVQNRGAGRRLMEAVLRRADDPEVRGVRLVQAAFHNRSFGLYSALGFDVREPLACLQGQISDQARERGLAGLAVRAATVADEDACNALARRVHGFDRGLELAQAVGRGAAVVVERDGRVTGYATHMAFFGHSTAETNEDMQALIAAADGFGGPGILVPSRNSGLLRWCLGNGLRVVQPMTLMTSGFYQEPAGAWLPSVIF